MWIVGLDYWQYDFCLSSSDTERIERSTWQDSWFIGRYVSVIRCQILKMLWT